jgi:hypothetical protein
VTHQQGENVRRSISAVMLALATGSLSSLSILSPVANAAISASISAAPKSSGSFGTRLVDVPVSEAGNPRALRYVIDYLPTGTVIHRRILIQNNEPRAAHFTVYVDSAHILDGLFTGDGGATRNELTGWMSVQHRAVAVAAGASVMDAITIKVPRGATRGEHYGVIWVQQAAKAGTPKSGFGVTEVSRLGIRVYLAVGRGGVLPTSFAITSITGQRSASGQPTVVAHVENTGGRAIDLNGSLRLTGGPGNSSSGPFPAQAIVTLAPGQSWNMTFAPPRSLPGGSWRAKITMVSGLTTATAAATVRLAAVVAAPASLSGMQWIWLSLGSLVLVLVIVMGSYAVLRRRSGRLAP